MTSQWPHALLKFESGLGPWAIIYPPRFSIILGQARYKGSPDNDWDADRHLLGCVVVELLVKY